MHKLDLLPRIRRRHEPQPLQRSQRALLARLVHNLPVPQREYRHPRKIHPPARTGLVQRPDGQVAERAAGVRAAADPAADDVRPARDEGVLVGVEGDVGEGLRVRRVLVWWMGWGAWGCFACLRSVSMRFAASLPWRGPCMG